jgi:hypothetical protein
MNNSCMSLFAAAELQPPTARPCRPRTLLWIYNRAKANTWSSHLNYKLYTTSTVEIHRENPIMTAFGLAVYVKSQQESSGFRGNPCTQIAEMFTTFDLAP